MPAVAACPRANYSFFSSLCGAPRIKAGPRRLDVRMGATESCPSVAVVGVTGAVGQEFLRVLSDRDFPYRCIKMLASKRSAGSRMSFEGKDYVVEELAAESFDGVNIALFSAGGSVSKQFAPFAVERGSIVVDNGSAFRMDDSVPLVIPEVNPEAMAHIKLGSVKGAIIANCKTERTENNNRDSKNDFPTMYSSLLGGYL
ncbi:uncharacterized protein [Aristolochia californica]|uniref:uncharacterized protein n=1 Tax=Aristolochia californica TaxID=171875 RepID=UPI0035DFD080